MMETAIHPCVWGGRWDGTYLSPLLESAAKTGYTHLVMPLRRPETIEPERIARAFEINGLKPLNTAGLGPDLDISGADPATRRRGAEHLKAMVRLARDMGSAQINGVLYGPIAKAAGPAGPDAFRASAETMAEIAEFAQGCGVRLALELVNRYETNLLNTVAQGLDYLSIAAHPNIGLHLDTFHMSIEEADPCSAIEAALPHLFYFELDQSHRGLLSQGSLDLTGLLRAVLRGGYRGLVGIEAFTRGRMVEDHADALAIWRETFDDADRVAREGMDLICTVLKEEGCGTSR